MSIDFDQLWEPFHHMAPPGGVSEEQIAEWESRSKVKLPEVFVKALRRQNGGLVRYSHVTLLPLDEIVQPDSAFWRWVIVGADEVPDRDLVFIFANEDDEEPFYLLNFNANGSRGEPSVHQFFHDPGEFEPKAKTIADFFAALITVAPTPAVDWAETDRLDVVLHRDTITSTNDRGEFVLGRSNGALVLYTHVVCRDEEMCTKTTLPEPLNPWFAFVFRQPPFLKRIYNLNLSPCDAGRVTSVESVRTSDGSWKTTVDHGFPLSVVVKSTSKQRLKALRETLLGRGAGWKASLLLLGSGALIVGLGVLACLYRYVW